MIELRREQDEKALKIGRGLVIIYDVTLRDKHQDTRLNMLLTRIDSISGCTLLAQSHYDEVHADGALR